ncbi:MAG: AraC family transcriptional regulator [Bacteroidaceae bacterium]|nr:AraC family transcriptional regulator [Bacteroidaceae bacterium]
MSTVIPYIQWRNHIEQLTPESHRIGDDLLLIDQLPAAHVTHHPLRADATTAIIYQQGSATFCINMKRYTIQAPCMLVILENSIYFSEETSKDLSYQVIVMSKRFTDLLFQDMSRIQELHTEFYQSPVLHLGDNLQIYENYLHLLQNILLSSESPYRLEAAAHLTLAMFYGYSYMTHQPTSSLLTRGEQLYAQFTELLHTHYQQERSVAFYADNLCITAKHLSDVVHEIIGKSPLALIQEYVVTEAKALLYSTDMTISQISDHLNFATQSEFGKFFKRVTGISPLQYRKKS